ncbi:MAG: hypothetical protein CL530_00735 [Aequorivita sp.]|nr:hypothetical protein [Aequorivita sp.]
MKLRVIFLISIFFISNLLISQTINTDSKEVLSGSYVYTGMTGNRILGQQEYIKRFRTYDTNNLEDIFSYPFNVLRSYSGGAIDPNNPNLIYTISYVYADNEYVLSFYDLDANINIQIGTLNYLSWRGLEFDPTSGILYAISNSELYSIDLGTANSTLIGSTGINPTSLAIDGSGQMYSYDINNDNFYSLDKNTGESTLIGPLGFDARRGGMAWDPNTNNIYLTDIGFLQYDFRIIDKNSGSSSILGALDPGVAFQENYYDWISFDGTALGLNVFDSLSFKVFPNPTNNMLNIQSKTPIENVKIYSPQGTLVNEYTSNSIDVSQLSAGIYFVEVTFDGNRGTKKFIKM